MRELLRFSHLRVECETGASLKDFNLSVARGEAVIITGMHQSGKRCVIQLLRGELEYQAGDAYINETRVDSFGRGIARRARIYFVDGRKSLAENLSVAENIFVVRHRGGGAVFFNVRHMRREASRALEAVGLDCLPGELVYRLSPFQQYLLCVAKGISAGARILVMNLAGNAFSYTEYDLLQRTVWQLKRERGIACLIVDETPGLILRTCDKVVVVHDGRDVKTMFSDQAPLSDFERRLNRVLLYMGKSRPDGRLDGCIDGQPDGRQAGQLDVQLDGRQDGQLDVQLDGRQDGQPAGGSAAQAQPVARARRGGGRVFCCTARDGQRIFYLKTGQIGGIYESTGFGRGDTRAFYRQFLERNGGGWFLDGQPLPVGGPRVVYIPENGGECLHPNLPLGDLLLAPRYPRLSGRFGFVNPRLRQQAKLDFSRRFGVAADAADMYDLTRVERRLLSVYRWEQTNPAVIVIDNPVYDLDAADKLRMLAYLRAVAARGIFVFVSLYGPDDNKVICDQLVYTSGGVWRQTKGLEL
ncbi:MAG: ATP-binding cassette domain-containing protein [Peptococcaceae bacterium]|jgi:ribose transport system ATP-binding protein|nr:ATP-binding cassette domain-containing protein [Peptococcaceae bacterium]